MNNVLPILEKDFLDIALNLEIREDLRKFDSYRSISIERLCENGQVLVKIGDTSVLAYIHSSLISPFPDKPGEGVVVFSVDMGNLKPYAECTNTVDDLNEVKNRIGNLLEKSLKNTK
jgi:exosome complex component RRP45